MEYIITQVNGYIWNPTVLPVLRIVLVSNYMFFLNKHTLWEFFATYDEGCMYLCTLSSE